MILILVTQRWVISFLLMNQLVHFDFRTFKVLYYLKLFPTVLFRFSYLYFVQIWVVNSSMSLKQRKQHVAFSVRLEKMLLSDEVT